MVDILDNSTGQKGLIELFKKWLAIILYLSILFELIFFPSWENFAGCLMSLIVWKIFSFFLKRTIILKHPFSFLIYVSMFLCRYIPLPATLLEGKPITWGFQVSFQTFFYETILFIISSLAFYAVVRKANNRNNYVQLLLYKFRFFEIDARILWILGLLGLVARIQQFSVGGDVEYGDVGNKLFGGFLYLQYAPPVMLFPSLSGISYNKRNNFFVWCYVALLFVLSFATNSRQAMIYPLFTIVLLFFLYLLKENISIFKIFNPKKIIFMVLLLVFGLNLLSNLSLAMLANRAIRDEVSPYELLGSTIETMQDEEVMEKLRNTTSKSQSSISSYADGWDETYLDNFMLNRFGNIRVSDQTLYYANLAGYGNNKIQNSFFSKIIGIFPLPILNIFGISIDKEELEYSPGDMLYLIGSNTDRVTLGTYRVTSLVADGLVTFGYFSFVIIFFLLFFSFKLVDCFVFIKGNTLIYSSLALINIFGFLGMYRNSIGLIVPFNYLLRGFWQQCITFWIVVFVIRLFFRKKSPQVRNN